jgi:O-antigen/teichoic acid export membrane protein
MSTIRKKGIITTFYIYIGFLLGALNTFFYFKYFQPTEYGLTIVLLEIAMLFSSMAILGSNTVVAKFFPYYRSHLKEGKSELLTIAFFFSLVGFLLLLGGTLLLQPLIIKKYSGKSPLLVNYFYLIYPITFFLVYFQVLESQAWNMRRAGLSNFLKEVFYRILCFVLIILFITGIISFHSFVEIFSWNYAVLFVVMLLYLMYKGDLQFSFRISSLTKRLWKKMLAYALFILGGNVISILSKTIDAIVISSVIGLNYAAVFSLAQYMSSVIEVPQRTATSMATPIISQAWKDRDMDKLASVYRKTSLTLLIASTFIFTMIWLNYDDAFRFLDMPEIYYLGKPLVLLLGLTKIIELGTGMNSAIIITSRKWKFELYSNMILLVCMLPLTYVLIKSHGLIGAGIANMVSITLFNTIRFGFLWKVYKLQPFTYKTLIAVLIPTGVFFLLYYTVRLPNPLVNIVVRSILFVGLYTFLLLRLKVSEDVEQVLMNVYLRIRNVLAKR